MEKNRLTVYLEREKKLKAKAKKNAVPLDEDLKTIMICAVRYSLGRQTYMPELVTGWIMNNCDGKLDKGRIEIMMRDIQEQRETGRARFFPTSCLLPLATYDYLVFLPILLPLSFLLSGAEPDIPLVRGLYIHLFRQTRLLVTSLR